MLWLALVVGIALALPSGWLLGMVASLPGELGLFFFLLVGLLIGAIMYRIALPAAPASRRPLYVVAAVVTLTIWMTTLVTEYLTLPQAALGAVRKSINLVLPPARKQTIEDKLRSHIHSQLKTDYPPGGIIGYMRWAATDGTMSLPRVIDSTKVPFRLSQRRTWWIVRVVLSLVFTGGAILSQILPLGRAEQPQPEPREPDQS